MSIDKTYDIDALKKVVAGKKQKGGGGSGGPMPDVEVVDPNEEEQEGQQGDENGEEGTEEGKKEGDEKQGDGKEDGEKKDGKSGKSGKSGKDGGEGEGESAKGGMSSEEVEKKANDMISGWNDGHNIANNGCGSVHQREEENSNSEESDEKRQIASDKLIEDIFQKIAEAEEKGYTSPLGSFKGRSQGEGGKETAGAAPYKPLPIPKRMPAFLREIKDFADKEYEKEYYKKGTDWVYSQGFGDVVIFKDRPKVAVPQKWMYLMVDVSGSMFSDFGATGNSLLEHLLGYLPTIAEEYKGEVWWISDGLITFDKRDSRFLISESEKYINSKSKAIEENITGDEMEDFRKNIGPKRFLGITRLEDFKGLGTLEQQEYLDMITNAKGAGGGTVYAVALQMAVTLRRIEGHQASIIMLTDSYIDDVHTRYEWEGKMVDGHLPPSTIIMTDTGGVKYMKENFKEDLDSDKRIMVYDITEDGKHSLDKTEN